MTTPHPDWQTNSIVKMFGSDLNVESIVLPIAREGDLYNNAKNEIGFSKNIPKSGGSLLFEDDVPSYYFKLFGDDSPVIRHLPTTLLMIQMQSTPSLLALVAQKILGTHHHFTLRKW